MIVKKSWIAVVVLALLALPAGAGAHKKPADVRNAAQYCKGLRVQMGADAFREAYGGKHNAFGKCVKKRVHELRDARKAARRQCKQELSAKSRAALRQCVRDKVQADTSDDADGVLGAAKQCAAEREPDPGAFEDKYGTNHNKRNAFGKCVSQHSDDNQTPESEPETGGDTTKA